MRPYRARGKVEVTKAEHAPSSVEKFAESRARAGLETLFAPKSVAVIGATERSGTVGRTVLWNLIQSRFRSKVYAVNPTHSEILGLKAYKGVGNIPEKVDLAVVATPASTVPSVIGECVDAGVKSAIVISAGFRERGPEGAELERQIQDQLRRGAMRLIGPNCLGVMNPTIGLNATFAHDVPRSGNVAFLSQSGALLTAILDWSQREQVGFSAIVSTGSMLDVGWGDLIYYFGDDPHTHSILLYMESVGDARSFLSAAREVALSKPIIVIKAGRSEAASRAAASHTGRLQEATKFSMPPSGAPASCGFTPLPTCSIWRKFSASNLVRKDHGSPLSPMPADLLSSLPIRSSPIGASSRCSPKKLWRL